MKTNLRALAALALFASANAHSWVEMMNVIAPNGTFTGAPGFARGNCQRAAGVDPDACMVHLLPPNGRAEGNKVLDSDPMCMPSQQAPTQSKDSPRLQATAGSMVALRYQENGHVSLPANQPGKPPNRGTVYIYGTTQPDPNEKFLSVHNVWNADGTGGDKRGKLLATQNFDDGQCYQLNGGAISTTRQKQFAHEAAQPMGQDLWCQNDLSIPSDAPSGKPYTLYWVDITGGAITSSKDSTPVKFVDGQSLNYAAVSGYVDALAKGNGNLASTAPGSSTATSQAPASSPMPSSKAPAGVPSSQAAPSPAPPAGGQPAPNAASVPQVTPPQPPSSAAAGPVTVTVTASAPPTTVTVSAGVSQNAPVSAGSSATAPAGPAVTPAANFQCNSCKMRRQTKILSNIAQPLQI